MRIVSIAAIAAISLTLPACAGGQGTPLASNSPSASLAETIPPSKINLLLLDKNEINALRPDQDDLLVQQQDPFHKPMGDEYSSVSPQGCFNIIQNFHSDILGVSYNAYANRKLESDKGARFLGEQSNVVVETIALYPDVASAAATFERLRASLQSCGNSNGVAHWASDASPPIKFQVLTGDVTDISASWKFSWAPEDGPSPMDEESHEARLIRNALIEVKTLHSKDTARAAKDIADSIGRKAKTL